MASSFDHPYSAGQYLVLRVNGISTTVRIKSAFSGSKEVQFTNSCTVLIEFDMSFTEHLQLMEDWNLVDQLAVLKIFDPGHSQAVRETYNCPPRRPLEASTYRHAPYSTHFYEKLPEVLRQTRTVQEHVEEQIIPMQPTYGDIIRIALQSSEVEDRLVDDGVLHTRIKASEREQYLEEICENMFRYEKLIFNVVEAANLHVLPRLISTAEVLKPSSTLVESRDEAQASALMLEYLPGTNLRRWLESMSTETEDDVIRTRQDIEEITSQTFVIVHSLMHCGLAPSDMRLDNIHVGYPESQKPMVRFYDAGANLLVQSTHDCRQLCHLRKPRSKSYGQQNRRCLFALSDDQAFYYGVQYFGSEIERATASTLHELCSTHSDVRNVLGYVNLNPTDCFEVFENPMDTIFWQIIMLCFWYFDDLSEAITQTPRTLKVMRDVRYILNVTQTAGAQELNIQEDTWAFIALARVCHTFCKDDYLESVARLANSTFRFLQKLQQEGVQNLSEYYFSDQGLAYKIFQQSPPLRSHRWRSDLDYCRLYDHLDIRSASTFVPDVAQIQKVVCREQKKHPSKLKIYRPGSDSGATQTIVYYQDEIMSSGAKDLTYRNKTRKVMSAADFKAVHDESDDSDNFAFSNQPFDRALETFST